MEADEDGRGLHLQPPNSLETQPVSPVSISGGVDAESTTSTVQVLPNLDEIDHELGINFNHLLDLPFPQQVPDINQSNDTDNETWQPSQPIHQFDLNLDALLSNTGKVVKRNFLLSK